MDERDAGLSERSVTILGLIAEGRSYDQILQQQPDATYFDIFGAAREALDLLQAAGASQPTTEVADVPMADGAVADGAVADGAVADVEMADITVADVEVANVEVPPAGSLPSFIERARAKHARAWARWTPDEDARLTALFRQGESRAEIVRQLGRQPGAVRSRLVKLGLVTEGEESGSGAAREVHPWASGAVDAPDREPRTPSPVVVPGWETLRDRLTPHQEIT